MLKSHVARYPSTQMILVGFSMGGNIVTKYMGQPGITRAPNILGAVAICQGYDAQRYRRCGAGGIAAGRGRVGWGEGRGFSEGCVR